MANNYERGTVTPYLPSELVNKYTWPDEVEIETTHDPLLKYLYIPDCCFDLEELAETLRELLEEWTQYRNDYPKFIYIKLAYFCDKMRQDEFGGVAVFITPHEIVYGGTDIFINAEIAKLERAKEQD